MDPSEAQRLRDEIERALHQTFDPVDVLPRLLRLSRGAPASSAHGIFAHGKLAELLVEQSPWRAALYARRVLAHQPEDDRAWAVLAFAHTLLGHYRSATHGYRRALAASPENPWYAHNLGHLLDVALGRPIEAVRWLRAARETRPESTEFAASLIHALARAGRMDEAKAALASAREQAPSRELEALATWLDQGAPARAPRLEQKRRKTAGAVERPPEPATQAAEPVKPRRRTSRTSPARRLTRALAQGIAHLPLADNQRARAFELAEEIAADLVPGENGARRPADADLAGLAAAVAYAIVYVDHLPLTQAEVAAPFRVGVGRLRGRFAELRARLDLIRGDVRYRTTRA